jgi:acyl-CoA dehydrogenase
MHFPRQPIAALQPSLWPSQSTTQRAVYEATQRFVQHALVPHLEGWERQGEIPREVHTQAAAIGLLGLGFPEAYGGVPADTWTRALATWALCGAGSGGVIAALMSHSIMVWPLAAAASERVKCSLLPALLQGKLIGALAVTEASGGSDVARLQTRAERCPGGWRLHGSKMYITSGMRADVLLVAARAGNPGSQGLSLFVVEAPTLGLERYPLEKTGWLCSDTAAIHLDGVFVPHDAIVGDEGRGFGLILQNFNAERLLMAIQALALAAVCAEEALAWAWTRNTFGAPLITHQVIRHKFPRMVQSVLGPLHWARSLCDRMDRGEALAGEIALLKNAATQALREVADQSVQILGGQGYLRASASERIYREVKVMMIGGGAEEVMYELAARQLGLEP